MGNTNCCFSKFARAPDRREGRNKNKKRRKTGKNSKDDAAGGGKVTNEYCVV